MQAKPSESTARRGQDGRSPKGAGPKRAGETFCSSALRAFDLVPLATFAIDADHRVILWNSACEALTGWRRDEMLGRPVDSRVFYSGRTRPVLADLVVDGDVEAMRKLYGGKHFQPSPLIEGAFEAEDDLVLTGEGRRVSFLAAPILDEDGRTIGAIETVQDVSRRAEAERALTAHRDRLRELTGQQAMAGQRRDQRLGRDLEAGIVQNLAALRLRIEGLRGDLPAGRRDDVRAALDLLDGVLGDASDLSYRLCPPMLYELGLAPALAWLSERYRQDRGAPVRLDSRGLAVDLPADRRGVAYECVAELLERLPVPRDGAEMRIDATGRPDGLTVEIAVPCQESDSGEGRLFDLRERITGLGGDLAVGRGDAGVRVALSIPARDGD